MTETDPQETLSERAARLAKQAAGPPAGESLSARAARLAKSQEPSEMPEPEIGYGERLTTSILNAAQGIPGMEAVEAAAGAAGSHIPKSVPFIGSDHPMTYQESLDALRGNVSKMSTGARVAGRMLGSVAIAPFLPANPAVAGAVLGGADQALSADPIHDAGDVAMRAGKTALGATAGAVTGKLLDAATTGFRGLAAATPGETALEMQGERQLADAKNYGAARNEGAQSYASGYGSPAAVTTAFQKPDIAPFVNIVKSERQFANADDATLLPEVFKRMTREQGGLSRRLKEQGYDAAMQGKLNNLQAAKEELLNAADQFMPSFRNAVSEHADAMGEKNALETGVDAGRRLMRNAKTPPKKLEQKSPEAILRLVASMPPEQQAAAEKGILGELGTTADFGVQPSVATGFGLTKGFGVGPYVADAARVTPLLRSANTPSQRAFDALVKAGLLSTNATGAGEAPGDAVDEAVTGGRRLLNGRSR